MKLLALVVLAAAALPATNPVSAEEQCRPWGSLDPGVCGRNDALQTYYNWQGTPVGKGSLTWWHSYGSVDQWFIWGRGYNNKNGWHVEHNPRIPTTPGETLPLIAGDQGNFATYAQFYTGGSMCDVGGYVCYAATKHSFQGPGSRLFYSSDDGAHSTVQCWDSSNPGDCAY